MFSRVTVAKPATTKKSRELERTSREPDFGSQRIRFFHGNENKVVSTLLSSKHQPFEKTECSAEAGDETGEAKGTRRRERILLDLQKPVIPAVSIEGVVKRIDLLGSILNRKRKLETRDQENQGNREHGCSWSGSGWHSSAARIVTFRRSDRARTDRKIRTARTDSQESEF